MRRGGVFLLLLLLLTSCRPAASGPAAPAVVIKDCNYRLQLAASGLVRVEASCRATGPISFSPVDAGLGKLVQGPALDQAGRFSAKLGRLSYALPLATLAAGDLDFDRALHVGASFMAPMSSVLLTPQPLTTEIPVTVEVVAEPGVAVAVGLERTSQPNQYRLMAHEIPVATYFSFGKLQQRVHDIDGATLDINQLDAPLSQSFDEVSKWALTSARAVRDFYQAFPVPRASITVIPVPDRDGVVFGKVLPESQPGIALLLGQQAPRKALYSDWILVHELFHLGFPSFYAEGKWLDEGLATYYEPIIRVRAGLYTETELWSELEASLPQGLPAYTELGLERATDFRGIYWGGALACLVADVTARKRKLDRGLEVGLRALREAGGNACEVWSLADVLAKVDDALGAPTLAPIASAHGQHGSPFDLKAFLAELGVSRRQGVLELSDAAPLAAVRRAITRSP